MKTKHLIILILAIGGMFASCEKEPSGNAIEIKSVYTYSRDTESTEISSIFFNSWIRIHGAGFTDLKQVYFNGHNVEFRTTNVTDTDIIINVPSSVPIGSAVENPDVLNTIEIVTAHGKAEYEGFIFKDPNKRPSISRVSYTMPYPGDVITIHGANLTGIVSVTFPDGTEGEIKSKEDSFVEVTVPGNVDRSKSGSMSILVDDERVNSAPYMFYQEGIFLKTFLEVDRTGLAANSNMKIINNAAEIAAATGIATNNPEAVLALPDVAKDLPVVGSSTWASFFRFWSSQSFQAVVDNPENKIVSSTSLESLAIQFEFCTNQPWSSGYISWAVNKDAGASTGSYRYNYYGWTVDSPGNFNGKWQTVTIPFSSFRGLALGSIGDYLTTIKGNNYQSLLGFSNSNPDNDGHTPKALTNVQFFLANLRLVLLN